jgi:hypothetical protein
VWCSETTDGTAADSTGPFTTQSHGGGSRAKSETSLSIPMVWLSGKSFRAMFVRILEEGEERKSRAAIVRAESELRDPMALRK